MSDQDEDFATLFEASVKSRRFDRGQTIEGTIVAFSPDVAFVDVGGKGEAQIDLAELKDADGDVEVSVGDRLQAVVVSTTGGIMLSRKGVRDAATLRELEDAYPGRPRRRGQGREGREGRLRGAHRQGARLLPALADRHRPHRGPGGARGAFVHLPHHRVQGRRQEHRRLAAQAARGGAARERRRRARLDRPRRGAQGPRGVGAGFRRLHRSRRHPGPAPRLRDELVADRQPRRDGRGRRSCSW